MIRNNSLTFVIDFVKATTNEVYKLNSAAEHKAISFRKRSNTFLNKVLMQFSDGPPMFFAFPISSFHNGADEVF